MALPTLNVPKYPLELPSTGETIQFRPFLVKEQKVLLMAQQGKKKKHLTQTAIDLIKACTFDVITEKSPLFDIEYAFLNIRAKSVGETVNLVVTCPDDGKTKESVKINLEDINVQMPKNHTNVINITDDIKLVMKYPTIKELDGIDSKNQTTSTFDVIKKCVDEIHDGDKILKRIDFTNKELDEFFDSFNNKQFESVMQFFDTMPKLRHEVVVKNSKTGVDNKIMLEGIDSFF
jgi:hypothetical protein